MQMAPPSGDGDGRHGGVGRHDVNLATSRSALKAFKWGMQETFFPDDPFRGAGGGGAKGTASARKVAEYYLPVLQWARRYDMVKFQYDVLAGVTIASLAIPQGISYARLAGVPPIIGLYSSFVPPLVYTIFGSSTNLAVGTMAAVSLMLQSVISEKVSPTENPGLYLRLCFTSAFFTGVLQTVLGFFRLGILVEFLSKSTISGFTSGTASLIMLQQLKGLFGLKNFTHKTDVVSVITSLMEYRHEWRWECATLGSFFLIILLLTRHLKKKKPKLFWVSAITPLVIVIAGGAFAYLTHADEHGIATVGPLSKGLNPISIGDLQFGSQYLTITLKAAGITGILALAEGIAVGRSLGILKHEQVDGNKEMIAIGLMNIVGSFTSCYVTSGPFSKSAVNFNAGCKTALSNTVMSACMLLVLLFLAPLFRYTPLVALSAIIMVAMIGLIEYEEALHFLKLDKFDFLICMSAFVGVVFISMDIGLILSVGLSILRTLMHVARPSTYKLGQVKDTAVYRDLQQYPDAREVPGMLLLRLSSAIYFVNASYLRERVRRWVEDETTNSKENRGLHYVIFDLGGVTSIDKTGVDVLLEIRRTLEEQDIRLVLTDPRIEVVDKLIISSLLEKVGKEWIFLSMDDAVATCRFALHVAPSCTDEKEAYVVP